MTDTENPRLAKLKADAARLQGDAALKYAATAIENLSGQLAHLRRAVAPLQTKNAAAAAQVVAMLETLAATAEKTGTLATERVDAYRIALTEQADTLAKDAAAAGDDTAIAAAEAAALALDGQVREAQRDLETLSSPLGAVFSALDRHLSLATLGAEAWAEFSGQPDASEHVLTGADAEWVGGTRRDEAPDGILYLTNRRLIFEQKEKVGKTLGLFGGKKVQDVKWALPLADIAAVRAKNAGMLGGRDMLYVEHPGGEYTLEVKGRASNDDWVAYIDRAKTGAFPLAVDNPAVPDAGKHAEIIARLAQERAERLAAAEAVAAKSRLKDVLSSAFTQKAAAEAPPEKTLSGLAGALRNSPETPATPAKGVEKGTQTGGALGGSPLGGAPKKEG